MFVIDRHKYVVGAIAAIVAAICMLSATGAHAVSTKLIFNTRFGWEVDSTTKANVCTVKSGDTCVRGVASEAAGGFQYDRSVAVDSKHGLIYVADEGNNRVQELTESGEFVLTFGWNVNRTKAKEGAPQAQRNVCTEIEVEAGAECQAGEIGAGLAGQMNGVQDVAVDPATGNVYILELFYKRVEEFTPSGEFVLMFGGDVDKTKVEENASEQQRNICTASSKDVCQAGEFMPTGSGHGAFRSYPYQDAGNLLAFGGSEGLLYMADEGRIQELSSGGEWKGEVPLSVLSPTARVKALAVDDVGHVYFAAEEGEATGQSGGVHEFDGKGVPVPGFAESEAGQTENIVVALAFDDTADRLIAYETAASGSHGTVYDSSGAGLGSFAIAGEFGIPEGIAVNEAHDVYVAEASHQEVDLFIPSTVPVPVTGGCKDITISGITLTGQVNPENNAENVAAVRAWFDYEGARTTGASTTPQTLSLGTAFQPVEAALSDLAPNENYRYRVLAEGETDTGQPEEGQTKTCLTLLAPPEIEGAPQASEITRESALLTGRLDPENADTDYFFEFGPCEEGLCSLDMRTATLKSATLGSVAAVLGADGLQPATTYGFRLVAVNHSRDLKEQREVAGPEVNFTTSAAPSPRARTEAVTDVGLTAAMLNGVVEPDGVGSTYSFELGLYNAGDPVYSAVVQGLAGPSSGVVPESFAMSGLQPGTAYVYRLSVSSAYGTSFGVPMTFVTAGLPSAITAPVAPQLLPEPKISFPKTPKPLTRAQKLARALKACKHGRKRHRASCERKARRQYGSRKKKK